MAGTWIASRKLPTAPNAIDVEVKDGPQVRWVYLTAWVTDDGSVNFRPDIYELDGTGFVIGQPLPVGQGVGAQRWVTKPLPYSYEDNGPVSAPPLRSRRSSLWQQRKQSGPVQIIKKTNFNRQPQAAVTRRVCSGQLGSASGPFRSSPSGAAIGRRVPQIH